MHHSKQIYILSTHELVCYIKHKLKSDRWQNYGIARQVTNAKRKGQRGRERQKYTKRNKKVGRQADRKAD